MKASDWISVKHHIGHLHLEDIHIHYGLRLIGNRLFHRK